MTEELEGYQPEVNPPIEIIIAPEVGEEQPQQPLIIKIFTHEGIGIAVNEEVDGGYTIFTSGEIESNRQTGTREVTIIIPGWNVQKASVKDEMPHRSIYIPERVSEAVTGQNSALTEQTETEDGNKLFEFTGNPAFEPIYRTWTDRQTGKQRRKAIFELATNPTEDDPGYRRFTAFDGLATYVKKNVHKGQTGVFVEAWGIKHWTEGEREVAGYYARKVKVPKRYRQGQKG